MNKFNIIPNLNILNGCTPDKSEQVPTRANLQDKGLKSVGVIVCVLLNNTKQTHFKVLVKKYLQLN